MGNYYFKGHEAVGNYVEGMLAPAGWTLVEDAAEAELAITYFSSQTMLEDAYLSDQGLIPVMDEGSVIIDLSPSTPMLAREIASLALVNDLKYIEAPLVVLNVAAAHAEDSFENITCFAAGEEDSIKAGREILEILTARIDEMGQSGSAQLARAAYTLQCSAEIVSLIEANALYRATVEAFGLNDEHSVGAFGPLAGQTLEAILAKRFEAFYTVEMFMGEIVAAMMTADDVDLVLPQVEAAIQLVELLVVVGGADKSIAALSLMYRPKEEAEEHGLNWARLEELTDSFDHDHDHDHGHTHEGDDEFDEFDDLDFEFDEDDFTAF